MAELDGLSEAGCAGLAERGWLGGVGDLLA